MSSDSRKVPAGRGDAGAVDAFLRQVAAMPRKAGDRRGRIIFALDATMSRQPTWDRACQLHADMFQEAAALGGVEIKLVYFRGFGECRASGWTAEPAALLKVMTGVVCRGGQTQIEKVLRHSLKEAQRGTVNALVYIGDCMEENIDVLCGVAGELGLLGVPAFMFHEGRDPTAATAFREIARLTRGAYCQFDAASAQQLKELLRAVAVYAAGGRLALQDYGAGRGEEVKLLIHQLK